MAAREACPVVFVAGSTGYIGSSFVRRYQGELEVVPIARRVTETTRRPTVLFRDLAATAGPGGNATLIHAIGCGRATDANGIYQGNVDTTRQLLAACPRLGVARVVYISGLGIGGPTSCEYYGAKATAEAMIRDSGIDHVILRCSYIVGGADELAPAIRTGARQGRVTIPGDGSYRIQPLLLDDVLAVLHALATTHRSVSGTKNLVGDAVTYRQFVRDLAARTVDKVDIVEEDLAEFIREAVFSAAPRLSLSELAILVADRVGDSTRELAGVQVRPYAAVVNELVRAEGG